MRGGDRGRVEDFWRMVWEREKGEVGDISTNVAGGR